MSDLGLQADRLAVHEAILQAHVCRGQLLCVRDLMAGVVVTARRRELVDAALDASAELEGVAAIFTACADRLARITDDDLAEEARETAGDHEAELRRDCT